MQALKEGSTQDITKSIEKLVELGADINATYPNGDFAGENVLIAACRDNYQDIFDLMINNNANVSVVSKSGKTAFYYAALNQNAEMLSHLIELSQNVENDLGRRYENNKSLMHVLFNNFSNEFLPEKVDTVFECIKILFNNGLDLDLTDDMLNTPLHLAAAFKNAKPIVEFLIMDGCDPQDTNKKGRTVYLVAHRNIVSLISELSMQDDVRKAIQERKEKKKEAEENKQARTLSFSSKSSEKASTLARKRRTQLLIMTRHGGTLRTPISSKQKASSKGVQSKTTFKKSEVRPWGGSKETAMFQRQTRIQIRQMKNEILTELQELREALNEVEKQLDENLGYANSEIATDNDINESEIHESDQNHMAEEDQISLNFDENGDNQETKEINENESGICDENQQNQDENQQNNEDENQQNQDEIQENNEDENQQNNEDEIQENNENEIQENNEDENQQNQDENEQNHEDNNQQNQDENEPVSIEIDLDEDHQDGDTNHPDQANEDEQNPTEVNDENHHNEEENQNDGQIENIEDHHNEEEALNEVHQENSDEIPTEEKAEDHQNEEEALNENAENEQTEENHEGEQANADEDHQVEIDVDLDNDENTEN